MKLNASQLLEQAISVGASDMHLSVGVIPTVRINTELRVVPNYEAMAVDDIELVLSQIMDAQQHEIFDVNKELDFSVALGTKARFRVNAFYQRGYPSLSLRVIPLTIPNLEGLNLPGMIGNLCNLRQGLVLVVGPTGHGKSTTLAAMIDRINDTRAEHIVTIEDPIEYIFSNKKSLIEQREMYLDTHSWEAALKSSLRQDPNVVLIGEMRDAETIMAALQISETGHLVLATLHTNSAAQTVERMITSFPQDKQPQVRNQLAQVIEVVISQRLLPSNQKGVVPAIEIMLGTDAVRNLIREDKTHMIDNIIGTSANIGMRPLEKSLAELVSAGLVEFEQAVLYTNKPADVKRYLKYKE